MMEIILNTIIEESSANDGETLDTVNVSRVQTII